MEYRFAARYLIETYHTLAQSIVGWSFMATAATNSLLKVANVILNLDDNQDHIDLLCIGIGKSHLSPVIVAIYLVFSESHRKSHFPQPLMILFYPVVKYLDQAYEEGTEGTILH